MPGYGLPVGGGGIRSWSLGKGLESRGHKVHYSLPDFVLNKISNPPESLAKYVHNPVKVNEIVDRMKPDMVIFQQWPTAVFYEPSDIPAVMDLHGSLLIENSYRHLSNFRDSALDKIKTMQKMDFFTCAGERQKWYWWAWLMMAGMDPKEITIATIPVSLSPDLPQHRLPEEPSFVFGGVSWAWQDPSLTLNTLADVLASANRGQLKMFVGKHPFHSIDGEKYNDLKKQMAENPRVVISEMIDHEQLIQEYTSATTAVDVMKRNSERELAFTTRTIEYLWCGLPVIYGDYLELSVPIEEYSAGWIVNPEDTVSLKNIVKNILENPGMIQQYSENAQKLVRDKYTWDKAIAPLDEFCQNPILRQKSQHILKQSTDRIDLLEQDLGKSREQTTDLQHRLNEMTDAYKSAKHDLDAIRNKTLFKLYKTMKRILRVE